MTARHCHLTRVSCVVFLFDFDPVAHHLYRRRKISQVLRRRPSLAFFRNDPGLYTKTKDAQDLGPFINVKKV